MNELAVTGGNGSWEEGSYECGGLGEWNGLGSSIFG